MKKISKFIFSLLIFLLALEFGSRLALDEGEDLIQVTSFNEILKKAWYRPHPHLVYTFKPNHSFMSNYSEKEMTTNEFGFRSSHSFDVKAQKKPENSLRVVTLGGSTTMGVNGDSEVWPTIIGSELQRKYPKKKIEVLNEGVMGYTSLDNLIDLSIRVIDFEADVYVFYLGVNDYFASTKKEEYQSDHSHFRRTLYENLAFTPLELVPSWAFQSHALRLGLQFLGTVNRKDLVQSTTNTKLRMSTQQFRKLSEYRMRDKTYTDPVNRNVIRNVKSMIGVIQSHNPEAVTVLSSFYLEIPRDYMDDLNRGLRALHQKFKNTYFVDISNLLRQQPGATYDYGHFTVAGDRLVGQLFARKIISGLENH